MKVDIRIEIKRYRDLVRRGDPATMEKRRLAREVMAPALPARNDDGR